MSRKVECPACQAYTSTAAQAFDDGDPCPYCGLSAEAWREVLAARERYLESELRDRYEAAVIRAEKAEAELGKLRRQFDRIQSAIGGRP